MKKISRKVIVFLLVLAIGIVDIQAPLAATSPAETELTQVTVEKRTGEEGLPDSESETESLPESTEEKDSSEAVEKETTAEQSEDKEETTTEQPENKEATSESGDEEETATEQTDRQEETTGDSVIEADGEEKEESVKTRGGMMPMSLSGPHNTQMPKMTRRYFTLQKKSKKVSQDSGSRLKVVANEKEGYSYIASQYGNAYNFTPRMTKNTKVTVGGGKSGGVSLSKVKSSSYAVYGDVYDNVQQNRIATRVYNLEKCQTNPYAIYSNVGTWYDSQTKRNYRIDMKMTVTGYLFPSKSIRKQLANKKLEAPYIGFPTNRVGLVVMGTDYVELKMDFYYSGTTTPVKGIRGVIQFADIDSQQGVDFGSGFQQILMFRVSDSHLQYNASGIIGNSLGYVSSRIGQNIPAGNPKPTTALGVFSGSSVSCRWTVAKCDHKDTGGNGTTADYYAPKGYGIPADSKQGEVKSYYQSNSTGFFYIAAEVGIVPMPTGTEKNIYQGKLDAGQSRTEQKKIMLSDRNSVFSYVIEGTAADTDPNLASYSTFTFQDAVSKYLKVTGVKVYADQAVNVASQSIVHTDVSSWFRVTQKKETDGATAVTAAATSQALSKASFYGRTYYLHLQVQFRTEEELKSLGLSIRSLYQENNTIGSRVPNTGNYTGTYAETNKAGLRVQTSIGNQTSLTSNYVASVIPMRIRVRKMDQASHSPVAGVTFGLFGGADVADPTKATPIMKAVTDQNGVAVFEDKNIGTFYRSSYGTGPYCIKELSIPASYHAVWSPSVDREWVYPIPTLQSTDVMQPASVSAEALSSLSGLENKNKHMPENAIHVYKKSLDTSAFLSGAEFTLMEWSQSAGEYRKIQTLQEKISSEGKVFYSNGEKLVNTMDNQGKYKLVETKAPQGCVFTGEEWTFEINENTEEDGSNLIYKSTKTGKTHTGSVIYRNPLQRGTLTIIKEDDEGTLVEGARFTVTAGEDIYAPWDVDKKGNPLPDAEPLTEKGTVVDVITTGAYGRGITTKGHELYIGKYLVQETGGAKDHIKSEEIHELEFQYNEDSTESLVEMQLPVSNRRMRPSFSVAKLADRTTDQSGGAVAFSKQTGRYLEEKQAGIYQAEEKITYTITLTNTGNVTLYNLHLVDDMNHISDIYGNCLSAYMDMETASFVIPKNGWFQTEKGKKIRGTLAEESNLEMTFDQLEAGDQVSVLLTVDAAEDAANAYQLENIVYGTAEYDDNENDPEEVHLSQVPLENLVDEKGESLVMDWDAINLPGTAKTHLLKTANKTTGITVENGEITEGVKIPGIYQEGENVVFQIIVKNTGTANLKNISVKDEMSEELRKIVLEGKASFVFDEAEEKETILTTAKGKKISAKLVSPTEVSLCYKGSDITGEDRLIPQDYVILHFRATILRDTANLFGLKNTAFGNAQYFDGNTTRDIAVPKDLDEIEIPGTPEAAVAKLANRTTGVTMEDGRYVGTKVTGQYENEEDVIYTITVTNIGEAILYRLCLVDEMSEELKVALDPDSISFQEGEYRTKNGKKVRGICKSPTCLFLDVLTPGDSVDVYLRAKVRKDVGNLFALDNVVNLTAQFQQGNEEAIQAWNEKKEETTEEETPSDEEKTPEENQQERDLPVYSLCYDSNNQYAQRETDEESGKLAGYHMTINACRFSHYGYRFTGWNTRKDGSGKTYVPGDTYILSAKNPVLYAQWEKVSKYRLTYDANNESQKRFTDAQTPCEKGKEIQVDGNPYDYMEKGISWDFIGWNTHPDGSGNNYKPGDTLAVQSDLTLYAQWKMSEQTEEELQYILFYRANNPSGNLSVEEETPAVAGTEVTVNPNGFTYPGYSFQGWNTRADGTGKAYKPGDRLTMPGKNQNLYAQWTKTARVLLVYHSNTEEDETVKEAEQGTAGQFVTVDGNHFINGGKQFVGWNTKADGTGTSYAPGTMMPLGKEEEHLYAQWVGHPSIYLLTYHSNEPEGSANRQVSDKETPGYEGTILTLDNNPFSVKGYRFVGWNTASDGSGNMYQPKEHYQMPDRDVNLYACWEKNTVEEEKQPVGETEEKGEGNIVPGPDLPSAKEETERAIERLYDLLQSMQVQDALQLTEEQEEIPVTDKMTDNDKIDIPGTPQAKVAKLADKTMGVSMENGRYTGTKREGTYEYQDTIDYRITVTNSGTADLYQLILKDQMEDRLFQSLEETTILFAGGTYPTKKGNTVKAVEENTDQPGKIKTIRLDYLAAGDSVEFHLTARVKSGTKAMSHLNNAVKLTAEYQSKQEEYAEIPVTDEMSDEDAITIGVPELAVAKAADRTKIGSLKNGRYVTKRSKGIYRRGETATFTITVTNIGTGTAKNIVVEDLPAGELSDKLKEGGFTLSQGDTFKTTKNATVKVLTATKNKIVLDQLSAGDAATLEWKGNVKRDVSAGQHLENEVTVTAQNKDGSYLPETESMKDEDEIQIVVPSTKETNSAQTGDDTQTRFYLLILTIGLLGVGIVWKKKRKAEK